VEEEGEGEEDSVDSAGRRLGSHPSFFDWDVKTLRSLFIYFSSYTCGGVGHLSRDCVQGSKCYNCSNVVSLIVPLRISHKLTCFGNVGPHQQGLPPTPEACLLYLWVRRVSLTIYL
jgi:hypothetical protein